MMMQCNAHSQVTGTFSIVVAVTGLLGSSDCLCTAVRNTGGRYVLSVAAKKYGNSCSVGHFTSDIVSYTPANGK